jgi:hypothetical protein
MPPCRMNLGVRLALASDLRIQWNVTNSNPAMSTFLRLRPSLCASTRQARLSTLQNARRDASTHALVFLEHSNGVVEPASLSALAAASQLGSSGGKITGVVVGNKEEVDKILPTVKK